MYGDNGLVEDYQDLHVAVRALQRSLERFDRNARQLAREIGGDFGAAFA